MQQCITNCLGQDASSCIFVSPSLLSSCPDDKRRKPPVTTQSYVLSTVVTHHSSCTSILKILNSNNILESSPPTVDTVVPFDSTSVVIVITLSHSTTAFERNQAKPPRPQAHMLCVTGLATRSRQDGHQRHKLFQTATCIYISPEGSGSSCTAGC
jgi:hypothetical protein